mgnify:CR=1 FL=1
MQPQALAPASPGAQAIEAMAMNQRLALERMPQPRFPITWNAAGGYHEGEDVNFCANARKLGFKLLVDPLVSRHLGHAGGYLYTLNATPLPYGQARAICWADQ